MNYLLLISFALMMTILACGGGDDIPEASADSSVDTLHTPLFTVLDTDDDGVVSREEHRAHSRAWFARWDRNGDKQLDEEERIDWLDTVFAQVKSVPPAKPDSTNPSPLTEDDDDRIGRGQLLEFALGQKGHTVTASQPSDDLRYHFDALDTSGDGVLAPAEVKGYVLAHFDVLDLDDNDWVDEKEFFTVRSHEILQLDTDGDTLVSLDEFMQGRYE